MVAKIPGAGIDANGEEIILDADADTTISADTDDQIDIKIAGADDFQFTANTFTVASGSTVAGALRPSFYAYKSSGQTIANNTNTKVTFETELVDSDGKFASSTFTPTVAGYYFISATVSMTNYPVDSYVQIQIWKNGSSSFSELNLNQANSSAEADTKVDSSFIIYLDGDDYLDIYIRQNSGGNEDTRTGHECRFMGFRIH